MIDALQQNNENYSELLDFYECVKQVSNDYVISPAPEYNDTENITSKKCYHNMKG